MRLLQTARLELLRNRALNCTATQMHERQLGTVCTRCKSMQVTASIKLDATRAGERASVHAPRRATRARRSCL
eukprot:1510749-Alexandrium_andersonii.AAC.1